MRKKIMYLTDNLQEQLAIDLEENRNYDYDYNVTNWDLYELRCDYARYKNRDLYILKVDVFETDKRPHKWSLIESNQDTLCLDQHPLKKSFSKLKEHFDQYKPFVILLNDNYKMLIDSSIEKETINTTTLFRLISKEFIKNAKIKVLESPEEITHIYKSVKSPISNALNALTPKINICFEPNDKTVYKENVFSTIKSKENLWTTFFYRGSNIEGSSQSNKCFICFSNFIQSIPCFQLTDDLTSLASQGQYDFTILREHTICVKDDGVYVDSVSVIKRTVTDVQRNYFLIWLMYNNKGQISRDEYTKKLTELLGDPKKVPDRPLDRDKQTVNKSIPNLIVSTDQKGVFRFSDSFAIV